MPSRKKAALNGHGDETPALATVRPYKKDSGRRNLRGKRGGLKDMPSMPLDILMEVRKRIRVLSYTGTYLSLLRVRYFAF